MVAPPFPYPPYEHFDHPSVRAFLENIRREMWAIDPQRGAKSSWLLWAVLETVHPAPNLPPLPLLWEAVALCRKDLDAYSSLPMEVRLWYASVLPYRFVPKEILGLAPGEQVRGTLRGFFRKLHPLHRSLQRAVDGLLLKGVPLLVADEALGGEFHTLKAFHFSPLREEFFPIALRERG